MLDFKFYYVPVTEHVKYVRALVRLGIAGMYTTYKFKPGK